ncbi:MAG TPA: MarR family transcriptional regulator [Dehalococcoidia bacterium]|nr:MarR family transcriptional regulator [Dehalococcoidia bacterium]
MAQEPQKEELIESILQLSDRAFRELFPILPKQWLRLDLTMSQLKVVLLIFVSGPMRMGVIASELGVSLATASGVVERLVERGILLREGEAGDRRVVLCRLSDEGERLIGNLWQLSRDQVGELMRVMAPSKLLIIAEMLQALLEAGEAMKGDLQLKGQKEGYTVAGSK